MSEKITQINKVIHDYFELNKSVIMIPAKDMMPYFIKAGVFPKDERNGLPIRRILRRLDESKQLSKIPFVIAERKQVNTNWFFGRLGREVRQPKEEIQVSKKDNEVPHISGGRKDSDEHYIIDLCDEILGLKGSRQHCFPFLLGDPSKKGTRRALPVDVYYESMNLVVEFNEQQHTKAIKHFDKPDKMTVSGVSRGEQRKIYDLRKRTILPQHGIHVIDIYYTDFNCDRNGKLKRQKLTDINIITKHISIIHK